MDLKEQTVSSSWPAISSSDSAELRSIPAEEAQTLSQAGSDARKFAVSGGVAQAVVNAIKSIDPTREVKIAKATAAGYKHGAYEGNELQLPASFVVDRERRISYAHYGKSAGDTPDVRSLAELLK